MRDGVANNTVYSQYRANFDTDANSADDSLIPMGNQEDQGKVTNL